MENNSYDTVKINGSSLSRLVDNSPSETTPLLPSTSNIVTLSAPPTDPETTPSLVIEPPSPSTLIGPLYMLGASFLFASMNLAVKVLENANIGTEGENISVMQIIFLRSLITYFLAGGMMKMQGVKVAFGFPSEVKYLLTLRGLVGFFALSCSYAAIGILPLGDATVLFFLAPTMIGILGYFLLNEQWEFLDGIASMFALIGVIFIARPESIFGHPDSSPGKFIVSFMQYLMIHFSIDEKYTPHFVGVVLGVLSALFQALTFITVRKIGKRAHSFHNPLSQSLVCGVGSGLVILVAHFMGISNEEASWIWPSHYGWFWIGVVSFAGFIGQICLSKALQADSAARTATFNYSQVVFAFLLEWSFFRKVPNEYSLIGAVIIGGSVVSSAVLKMRRSQSHH